jgi:hypothetical protein
MQIHIDQQRAVFRLALHREQRRPLRDDQRMRSREVGRKRPVLQRRRQGTPRRLASFETPIVPALHGHKDIDFRMPRHDEPL